MNTSKLIYESSFQWHVHKIYHSDAHTYNVLVSIYTYKLSCQYIRTATFALKYNQYYIIARDH